MVVFPRLLFLGRNWFHHGGKTDRLERQVLMMGGTEGFGKTGSGTPLLMSSLLLQFSAVHGGNSCSGEIYPHQMITQSRFSSVPKIHSAASRHSQCHNIYPKPYSKSSRVISFVSYLIWQMRGKSTRLQPNPEYKPFSKSSRVTFLLSRIWSLVSPSLADERKIHSSAAKSRMFTKT